MRETLFMIATHRVAQCFHRPELQLFDCAFTASQLLGNLAHTFSVDEAALNHQALVIGQPLPKLKEHRPPFYLIASSCMLLTRIVVASNFPVPAIPLPPVPHHVA